MGTTDSVVRLSDPVFRLIRLLLAIPILIAVFVTVRWAVMKFLGVRGRDLGRRKYLYAMVSVLVLGLLEWLRHPIETRLTAIGGAVSSMLPYLEAEWVSAVFLATFSIVMVTVLLLLLIQVVGALFWFFEKQIDSWNDQLGSSETERGSSARIQALRFGNRILRVASLSILVVFYLHYAFRAFPRTRVVVDALRAFLGPPLRDELQAVANYLPNLGYVFVIVVVAWLSLRGVKYFFNAIENGNLVFSGFPADWAEPTYNLCRTLISLFVLMVSYPYLPGANSEFFRGFSVFAGALVTFGSSAAIGNIVAGIVLTYTRGFRVGDMVKIGDTFGKVTEKTLLSTRIRTGRNELVTFPNGSVLSGSVINYSERAREEGVSLAVSAGIGYDVDWRTIHKLMIEGARRTEAIIPDPPPRVLEMSFDEYSVKYELRAWTDKPEVLFDTYAALRRNLLDTFNEAGVEIMTPSILGHRDASNQAIPEEKFPKRSAQGGIAISLSEPEAKES
jgi:small-conductance mechanosensitive channel